MLAASGWWGKAFLDSETVHPLLFPTGDGTALWALNPAPAFAGLGLATKIPVLRRRTSRAPLPYSSPRCRHDGPKARLRTTRYRGVDTATMLYDQLPINDVFRPTRRRHRARRNGSARIRAPYFFVLQRDDSLRLQ